jgi:sarcosine oxidase subunit beta
MALTADVVIIGGGVIGASVAYHLAARGCRDVLVLERGVRPGEGSTGRATGGFRAQFATPINIQLSLLSRDNLLDFRNDTGVDPGFRQCGYLFIARRQAELDALLSILTVQHECGVAEARAVSAQEISELNPAVETEGVIGGVYSPSDGFTRPLEILRGYTEEAVRLGARFEHGVALEGFHADSSGRLKYAKTTAGAVAATLFVNAAGAWAASVARLAGVDIPVAPLRRQVAVTRPFDLLPEEMPMTIFVEDGFHLRVRDGRVLLLWPDEPLVEDAFDTSVEDDWVSEVTAKAHARVPCLKGSEIDRDACWAGLYEMTPDRHALLGVAHGGAENFYLANGSSGHGVMHSPALGQLLAEIILDGEATTLDVRPLRPSRFDEGEPNTAPEFL